MKKKREEEEKELNYYFGKVIIENHSMSCALYKAILCFSTAPLGHLFYELHTNLHLQIKHQLI